MLRLAQGSDLLCAQFGELLVGDGKNDAVVSAFFGGIDGPDAIFLHCFFGVDPRIVNIDFNVVLGQLAHTVDDTRVAKIGAVLCAQYFSKSDKLALGVADAGRGIFGSMRIHHPVSKPKDAIARALLPGVSGVTPKLGGDEFNAGAGLFFTKAIASSSQNYMTLYSGDALFKLREAKQRNVVYADPNNDNALWLEGLPEWSGTAVGINVSLEDQAIFSAVLSLIRKAYAIDLKAKKKAKYKKPRFV